MNKICKEIVFKSNAIGTTDVMDYADEHPNEYFDCTIVHSEHTDYGHLFVSEFNCSKIDLEAFNDPSTIWEKLYNGWQRHYSSFATWICRKNERYLIITC